MSTARNATRWLAANVLGSLGFPKRFAVRRRCQGRFGIILRYHRVIPLDEPPSYYRMGIGEELFEAQMKWLASHRTVVSLEELLQWIDSKKTPPDDLVVLTFDDGYLDNRTHAVPILRLYGLPATFYVTSSCLTDRMPFWPELVAQMVRLTDETSLFLGEEENALGWSLTNESGKQEAVGHLIGWLRKRSMDRISSSIKKVGERLGVDVERAVNATPAVMGEDDLKALVEAGFSIGAHTVTHPYLTAESSERQRQEIEESRRRLESVVGQPVLDFCYPGGGHDETTRRIVATAGYRSATTSELGIAGRGDDRMRLARIGVGEALATGPSGGFSGAMMHAEITGYFSELYRKRLR